MRRPVSRKAQRGMALIVFATVLIMGFAWYAVGAMNNAVPTAAEREMKTGLALQEAKKAFLAYVAQYAARTDDPPTTDMPGRLPCPESVNLTEPGEASSACSNVATSIGRLPWKTLGVDQIVDGYGEPLWLAISQGFRAGPINFDTVGRLTWNGAANSAVAVIIAPGRVLNTLPVPGTPTAGCVKASQAMTARNTAPLDPTLFLECGNAANNFRNLGTSVWTNDRAIAITQAEWADAIAGPVADRIQRQVAPAMENFRANTSNTSWGQRFLPNASTIDATVAGSQPENNNLCGNLDMRTGMPPTATVASGLCDTDWSSGAGFGVPLALSFGGCAQLGTEMRCTFVVLLGGILSPWLSVTAPRVAYAFRAFDPAAIRVELNGVNTPGIVRNYTDSMSTADGSATIQFELNLPFLALASTVVVRIPNATDALAADTRTAWFLNNGWDRHTYYGVAPAATHDTEGGVCNPGGVVTGCLNVFGMPAPANDKRLVLILMGRPLAGTTQPSFTLTNYMEDQNASVGVNYDLKAASSTFNDRVAACPYNYYASDGTTVLLSPC